MRKTKNILTFIFSLFYLIGCGQERIDPNLEQEVFIELLPKIVDSMFVDVRPIPPLPKEIRNEKNIKIKLQKWKEYKINYFKDKPKYNTEFIIAIEEKIEKLENISSSKVNFEKIKNTEKFIFKPRKEFPLGIDIWKERMKYNFAGVFSFSRIEFDKQELNGKLWVNYSCGGLCGQGGVVYLKKNNDKWEIEKIEILEVL